MEDCVIASEALSFPLEGRGIIVLYAGVEVLTAPVTLDFVKERLSFVGCKLEE